MNPYGAHYHVGLGSRVIRQWLGDGPDMVRQDGSSIRDIGGKEEGNRVDEDRGNGRGNE